jgi:hypothetical protein
MFKAVVHAYKNVELNKMMLRVLSRVKGKGTALSFLLVPLPLSPLSF